MHRLVSSLIAVAAIAAVIDGSALPVNAVSSIAIGWGIAAGLHLAAGSPLGLPSADEVAEGVADLRVSVKGIVRAPRQIWGVAKFTGLDATGMIGRRRGPPVSDALAQPPAGRSALPAAQNACCGVRSASA